MTLIGGIEKVGALLRWPQSTDETSIEENNEEESDDEPPSFPIEEPQDAFTSIVEGVIKSLVEQEKTREQVKDTREWVKVSITTNEVQEEQLYQEETSEEIEIVRKGGEEWANSLLQVTWPYVSQHISSILTKTIEPALEKSSVGAALRLLSVSLGDVSPTLSETSVSTRRNGSLRVNTKITWDTEVALSIDAGPVTSHVGVSAGIDHVRVSGLLTLVLGPPCATTPYFNAIQIFFPNKPDIYFRLSGLGMLAGSLPGVSCAIQSSVDEALAKVCVLPKYIAVALNSGLTPLQAALYKCPAPEGILHLKVTERLDIHGTQSFLWGDDGQPTTVRIRMGTNSSTDEDGVYFMIHCLTQQITFEVLDQRDQVMCTGVTSLSGGSQVLFPDRTNLVKLQPAGTLTVLATWNTHPKDESPRVVSVALSDVDIQPPPPKSAGPLFIRVSCAGGDTVSSSAGTAKWNTKTDQAPRNELLLGSINRLETFGVSNNIISEIVGLPPVLIAEYFDVKKSAEGHLAQEAWLAKAKKEFDIQSTLTSPHFSEVLQLLVPPHCDAASFELVGSDGVIYAVHSTQIDIPISEATEIHKMQPTEGSVGSTVCVLKASVTKTVLESGDR